MEEAADLGSMGKLIVYRMVNIGEASVLSFRGMKLK
jgi:hypothetical protein